MAVPVRVIVLVCVGVREIVGVLVLAGNWGSVYVFKTVGVYEDVTVVVKISVQVGVRLNVGVKVSVEVCVNVTVPVEEGVNVAVFSTGWKGVGDSFSGINTSISRRDESGDEIGSNPKSTRIS